MVAERQTDYLQKAHALMLQLCPTLDCIPTYQMWNVLFQNELESQKGANSVFTNVMIISSQWSFARDVWNCTYLLLAFEWRASSWDIHFRCRWKERWRDKKVDLSALSGCGGGGMLFFSIPRSPPVVHRRHVWDLVWSASTLSLQRPSAGVCTHEPSGTRSRDTIGRNESA